MSEIESVQVNDPAAFSVGASLRTAREARGMTLEQIAEKLKLSTRQLNALERDDYDALPGNIFIRGFVRNYARLLELDPQPLLDQLSALLPQERVQVAMPRVGEATALNTSTTTSHPSQPWLLWVSVVCGLLLGVGGVFWYLQKPVTPEIEISADNASGEMSIPVLVNASAPQERTSEPDSIPVIINNHAASAASSVASMPVSIASSPVVTRISSVVVPSVASRPASSVASVAARASVPSVTRVAAVASRPAVIPTKVAVATPAVTPAKIAASAASAVATSGLIRVLVERDSWVQIVDANQQTQISILLPAGSERWVSGKPPFQVKIGNAPKTRLFYRGKAVDLSPYVKSDVATLELK